MSPNAESVRPPQDVVRALANFERLLYAIPNDGSELRLRYSNGRIQRLVDDGWSQGPRWEEMPFDYGSDGSNAGATA